MRKKSTINSSVSPQAKSQLLRNRVRFDITTYQYTIKMYYFFKVRIVRGLTAYSTCDFIAINNRRIDHIVVTYFVWRIFWIMLRLLYLRLQKHSKVNFKRWNLSPLISFHFRTGSWSAGTEEKSVAIWKSAQWWCLAKAAVRDVKGAGIMGLNTLLIRNGQTTAKCYAVRPVSSLSQDQSATRLVKSSNTRGILTTTVLFAMVSQASN